MPTAEQLRLMALCKIPRISWWVVAREAQRPGGLDRLLAGEITESSDEARATAALLAEWSERITELTEKVQEAVAPATEDPGIGLTTVLDDDYPVNLRLIFDLPPFLFYRGELMQDDARAVAVVGTRQPSPEGIDRARRMARGLAGNGVTVLSGLARGIDTAAHEATLEVGGRTIAVLGSGIERVYPPENQPLAEKIAQSGAVVSQFWPTQAPARYTFPWRNRVTSGLGQGTVVIEASATSGAKMQARLAIEHGKKAFIVSSLAHSYEWARKYVDERGAIEVSSVEDVLRWLRSPEMIYERSRQIHQEVLALE